MKRVLIANRGEIAYRAVRVCRELGISSVAVYSKADARALHVSEADQAVCIGPSPSTQSYLQADILVHVAKAKSCDAIYPGYGFLSENASFAERCEAEGLKFIGPSADAIHMMGDKARAREMAMRFDILVVPGSDGAFLDSTTAQKAAAQIKYPLLLKARSGGGGRGMRIVEDEAAFAGAFSQATHEADAAFGDGAIYLERFFPTVRHIEVQVLGDGKGGAIAFAERDCSVQRRHQKLVEETPSPAVNKALRDELMAAAKRLTSGIGYEGAGTVEFILSPKTNEAFFIEMNTRIQVEHPVTEALFGLDLVKAQFEIAAGANLYDIVSHDDMVGHAIEFRINAEDWRNDFRPSPGRILSWCPPGATGVRLDTAIHEGSNVPPYYDSMIAKLIIHGHNRSDAISKARAALNAFVCEGIETTIGFHKSLLDSVDFQSGRLHTRWVETNFLST